MKAGKAEIKYVVKGKKLIAYNEEELEINRKSYLSMLEAFQIEVFSFLIALNEKNGNLDKFAKIFRSYFDRFNLNENRISRALDICLDTGFFLPRWRYDGKSFRRVFENNSEASEAFKQNLKIMNGKIEEKTKIFERL